MKAPVPENSKKLYLEIRELNDAPDMETVFSSFAHMPYSCFLDSGLVMDNIGRYSFIGFNPHTVLASRDYNCRLWRRDGHCMHTLENPFDALRRVSNEYRIENDNADLPPFLGGGMGYLAYETGRCVENLPGNAIDDIMLPEMCFAFYDHVIARDCHNGNTWLVVAHPDNPKPLLADAVREMKALPPEYTSRRDAAETQFKSNFSRKGYIEAVRSVKEYIIAGDIYQANLSQRFQTSLREHPWTLYRRLRRLNAAPFSAYFNVVDGQICSSSPERFMKVEGDNVQTRPIKGTRPRSLDPETDKSLADELLSSPKDRAELSMIVDLERNDLGRVCEYGSVNVEKHAAIEHYATVHHLVSTVTGKLHREKDFVDLLKGSFPGGSITGAPKIRSMEIIDELEPTARSVYTGSIGYLGYNGIMDTNIAIRTIIAKGDKAYFQVGGGIVADSVPEDEYQETLDKGKAIFAALSG